MLKEKISADLKEAMKAGDQNKLAVLRMVNAAISNRKIEVRAKEGAERDLTDEEIIEVLTKEAKKRRESIVAFTSGGRADLAEGESAELKVLEAYLPTLMSEAEIKDVVTKIVASLPVGEFGPAMKEVMKELKGKADASIVSKVLKEIIG